MRDMAEAQAPFLPVRFIPRQIDVERRAGGTLVLRNRIPLRAPGPHIPALLRRQAALNPMRIWLAQRRGPDRVWLTVNYGAAVAQVDALTQFLLDLREPGRPIMVLSGNSIEHGLLALAAMQARMPLAPITPAYSLLSNDHEKLKAMAALLDPAAVFVQNARQFERALRVLDLSHVKKVLYVDDPIPSFPSASWASALATPVSDEVSASVAAIDHDTVAKYLFTSGSTGKAKAVITTQRMLTSATAMATQLIESEADPAAPVKLDWLPWSHVMGGSAVFHGVLEEGGTLYIDDGRPVPGAFEESIRNLKEISPVDYANVPAGYAMLVEALERDEILAGNFFRNLRTLLYAGARLPDDICARMQALAVHYTAHRIPFVSGYGSTETGPSGTWVFWATERVGLLGLPQPGVELKLVPLDEVRYEVRFRSSTVTPGYLHEPELTRQAFDEEGFYKMGDAASFVDARDPHEGLVFAGRIAEEFKLQSGVFVRVGTLRVQIVDATAPLLRDVVVAGADRAFIGLLAWPNLEACRTFLNQPSASLAEIIQSPVLHAALAQRLMAHNRSHPGSSTRIRRLLLLAEPPSMDAGEMTDKGYVNQRRVLERRTEEIARLFADHPDQAALRIAD